MKKVIILLIVILVIYLLFLGIPQTKSMLAQCSGIYTLNTSLNEQITNDAQAFQELKNYWTVYDPHPRCGGVVWQEDAIPSTMTAQEAKDEGILDVNRTITLDTGENVTGVWTIYGHRAIDKEGDVYFCKI